MDIVSLLTEYIKPELLVVAVVLYFIRLGIQKTEIVKEKFIPILLGGISILISTIYVIATTQINGYQEVMMAIFTSIIQGILVAGISVYAKKIIENRKKDK